MYLGYDISSISKLRSLEESACLDLGKRTEISESELADLFGLTDSSNSSAGPAHSLAHLPHGLESTEDIQYQLQNGTCYIDCFKDFSI